MPFPLRLRKAQLLPPIREAQGGDPLRRYTRTGGPAISFLAEIGSDEAWPNSGSLDHCPGAIN